jgi:hypothetical protein
MCAQHIYANWRKKHRLQEYQKRFWKIAKSSNEMQFTYYKNKLAAKTPKGWDDLQKTDPVHWCRAWFKAGSNCESVDNNVSESFNSWIIDAPLAIEPGPSKGKGHATSSSTKTSKRKTMEGYGVYYSERTGSSFLQVNVK